MKIYIFQSGDELMKLKVDRANKKFEIASHPTNYRFMPMPFWKLFGHPQMTIHGLKQPTEEESRKEMLEAEQLNESDFDKKLMVDAAKLGYTLLKMY